MARLFILTALALLPLTALDAETLVLTGGAEVRGDVILERADSVVVDLGFRVLEIPRDAIAAIRSDDGETSTRTQAAGDSLIGAAGDASVMSVEENVTRVSEAVVQVRTPIGLGSGFVIHPDGYVITNQHVISGEHRISVTVFRQTEHELERTTFDDVRIVAIDPDADLALLKIQDDGAGPFAAVPLVNSGGLRQGETVFAVGSPLGLDRSEARGIVSLTDRVLCGSLFIQTTTAINPGNSGGPLFNLRGEVVGVSNLKLAGIGLEGLSFAIPADTVRDFVRNRSAYAFDPRNPNAGFRYHQPARVPAEEDTP
jgi:serine protease Do